jgi:hypothetical protein
LKKKYILYIKINRIRTVLKINFYKLGGVGRGGGYESEKTMPFNPKTKLSFVTLKWGGFSQNFSKFSKFKTIFSFFFFQKKSQNRKKSPKKGARLKGALCVAPILNLIKVPFYYFRPPPPTTIFKTTIKWKFI